MLISFMLMSPQPDDASPADPNDAGAMRSVAASGSTAESLHDPNDAGAMCSVATSGSPAESLHRSIEAFPRSCMVASACAGISGVCSVTGQRA